MASEARGGRASSLSPGDALAAAVLAQFESLPRGGKPQPHEHTVLAGIALTLPAATLSPQKAALSPPPAAVAGVGGSGSGGLPEVGSGTGGSSSGSKPPGTPGSPQEQQQRQQQQQGEGQAAGMGPFVVAVATGTKCLPASKRNAAGRALNDCHAEVACRRALLRWVYCEMKEAVRLYRSTAGQQDGTAVLQLQRRAQPRGGSARGDGGGGCAEAGQQEQQQRDGEERAAGAALLPGWQFELRPGVQLHMYVSQPPCGDASILGCSIACIGTEALPAAATASTAAAVAAAHAAGSASMEAPSAAARTTAAAGQQLANTALQPASSAALAAVAVSLGRTGAKPIKRAKLSHTAAGQGGPGLLGCSESAAGNAPAPEPKPQPPPQPPQPQPLQEEPAAASLPGQEGQPAATVAAAAAAAGGWAEWAVPQAHEVESYAEGQVLGVVRRKPGRGEATLSMSCSDKLARWALLGLQGSLLSGLLAGPLRLSSLTISLPPPTTAQPLPSAAAQHSYNSLSEAAAAAGAAGPAPTTWDPAGTAQAAAASARRALVERTAPLAELLLEPFSHAGLPPLQVHIHSPASHCGTGSPDGLSSGGAAVAAAAAAAAPAGAASQAAGAIAGAASQAAAAAAGAASQAAGPAASAAGEAGSASSQVDEACLGWELFGRLGLAPMGGRRVAGGSTVIWHAPPSTAILGKGGLKPVAAKLAGGTAPAQQAQQAAAVLVVRGGTGEAVAGTTGVKLGSSRKGSAAVAPAAAPCVCKAALLSQFLGVVGELEALPQQAQQAQQHGQLQHGQEQQQQQGAGGLVADAAPGVSPAAALEAAAAGVGSGGGSSSSSAAAGAVQRAVQGLAECSYREMKGLAGMQYQAAWRRVVGLPGGTFEGWIPKPAHLEDFHG